MRKWMMSGLCLCLLLAGQTRPTTQGSSPSFADFSVSEARIQDLKGFEFLHSDRKMTIRQMHTAMDAEVQKLLTTTAAQHIAPAGPLVLIMNGMTSNPDEPFDIQTGFSVTKGTPAPVGYQVATAPTKRFATVIYSGPLDHIGLAYRKVYSAVFGAGLTPGEETRQYYLYWEGIDSVNNVVMIAVEVQ